METQSVLVESQPVKVAESRTTIPTYGPLGVDPWPSVFFKNQWYAPFYPLHRYVHPPGPRHDRDWITVTLENEYLRVVLLPELGGHVWEMFDKVCGQHLIYNNDAVKPTRIGFRTGWCALGIEFNFPVAHSLQSIDPLPYRIERADDGSVSLLTWHRDRPRRIEMILRLTLRPGRRDLQVRAEMYNPSCVRGPYDYWTNAAVPARPDAVYIYPTRWMQAHGGRKIYDWPIVNGDDMRFQSNYQRTVSFFAWEPEPPFFGCWWSDSNVGFVHVGDAQTSPGKKLFNWGRRAGAWQNAVTDRSGPYAELQAGRFATQADYEWLQPGGMDVLEEAWYGYAKLGGLSWAGRDLAMHVQLDDRHKALAVALHAVGEIRGATVRVTADDHVVHEERMDLLPAEPVRRGVDLPAAPKHAVTAEVLDAAGEVIGSHTISLQPTKKRRKPTVPAEKWESMFSPLEDKDAAGRAHVGEVSELHNLWPRAKEAYEGALQADPNCREALLGLAFVALRNADFAGTVEYGRRLMAGGSKVWRQAGAYVAGAAKLLGGHPNEALEALPAAARHPRFGQMARLLLAMAQARLGKPGEALRTADSIGEPLASRPIVLWLKAALTGDPLAVDPAAGWTVPDDAELLDMAWERAVWSIRIGRPDLGTRLLENLLARSPAAGDEPLTWYMRGYLEDRLGRADQAGASLRKAQDLTRSARLPGHPEWVGVLRWALEANPADPKPHAYVAPLAYWLARPDEAIEHWRRLVEANHDADSSLHYGLAMGLWESRDDRQAATRILTEALARDPRHERLYLVLDDVLVEGRDNRRRGEWLAKARANVGDSDYIIERYCGWLVNEQRWADAVELLRGHKFGPSHGFFIRRRMWLLSHRRLAEQCLQAGQHQQAYEYGIQGANPPATLGEDDMMMTFASPALLAAAEAAEKTGDKKRAIELCHEALDRVKRGHIQPPYTEIFRARVLLKLGKRQQAQKVLQDVLHEVLPRLNDARPSVDKAHFHYLYALALETQGKLDEAKRHYAEAERRGVQWANLIGYGVGWGFN